MAEDIQRADPRLRRTTSRVLAIAVVAALVFVAFFQWWLGRSVATTPTAMLVMQLQRGAAFALLASGLCLLLLGGYLARLATRVGEQQRWPLEHVRVIRDTPIRRGPDSRRIGRWLNIAAVLLTLFALAVGVISWQLFKATY